MATSSYQLNVSTYAGPASLWLYLDHQLIVRDTEEVSAPLRYAPEYIVSWFVDGPPGSLYSITISSPREAEYQLTRAINASGKDHGSYRFSMLQPIEPKPLYQ